MLNARCLDCCQHHLAKVAGAEEGWSLGWQSGSGHFDTLHHAVLAAFLLKVKDHLQHGPTAEQTPREASQ